VAESPHIRFDGWTLDRTSGELTRDGRTQRLPPQPMAMLVTLLDRAGEVVTREALVQVLWPKGIVDFDNSLNAAVRKLRTALGDDPEAPRYIETLPRIGYRFIGPVGAAGASSSMRPPVAEPSVSSRVPWISRGPLLVALIVAVLGVFAWVKWPGRDVRARATGPESVSQDPRVRTTSRRAYELYLDGKYNASRRDDVSGGKIAIERYEAALKEDPYFAEAWAALAEAHVGQAITQRAPLAGEIVKARSAALRAIELNPKLAAGHSALAIVKLQHDQDYAGAEAELRAALAADDRYARLWHTYALLRGHQGRTEEAFEYLGRARELEPMTLLYSYSYGNLLYLTRQYDAAIEFMQPLLASQPRFDQGRDMVIRAMVAKGDISAALAQLPLRFSVIPTLSDPGLVYARAGMRREAQEQIAKLERRRAEGYSTSYELAIVQAALGDLAAGCAALGRAREERSMSIGWMRLDPRLDPLRDHPCYAEVEKQLYGG
jgi:DNA-binding winged helix-turn-helix (wHTH) protein/Tfp pilus assembly protein PilF